MQLLASELRESIVPAKFITADGDRGSGSQDGPGGGKGKGFDFDAHRKRVREEREKTSEAAHTAEDLRDRLGGRGVR